MNAIANLDVNRLAKNCGLFSSDHAGERAAAAWRADQMVRGAGLTWTDVLAPVSPPQGQPATSPASLTPGEILARHGHVLSAWERQFLVSLMGWRGRWTAKQRRTLADIREKILRTAT